jgi:hypothetical protein
MTKDDESFLMITGMGRAAFNRLKRFIFRDHVQRRIGRPELLDYSDKLGLLLLYLNSNMRLKDLCLIFGVTPTRASKILKDMFPLAIGTLKSLPSSRVKFPNQEKMAFTLI